MEMPICAPYADADGTTPENAMSFALYGHDLFEQAKNLIGSLGRMLMARGMMFGLAESCTGGLASCLCTEIPGSSAWFAGGVVSYANQVKQSLLGVEEAPLVKYGAVSGAVAEAMALGAVRSLNVQLSAAVSGIAGPGGGTPEKPVGTVWIGIGLHTAGNARQPLARSECFHFSGSRQDIRAAAVLQALRMAIRTLETDAHKGGFLLLKKASCPQG